MPRRNTPRPLTQKAPRKSADDGYDWRGRRKNAEERAERDAAAALRRETQSNPREPTSQWPVAPKAQEP